MRFKASVFFKALLGNLGVLALVSQGGWAGGLVTPSEMSITFTGVEMIRSDGKSTIPIWAGSKEVTFKRADADFSTTSLGTANIPEGRYLGVKLLMGQSRSVKLDGNRFRGSERTYGSLSLSDGTQLYTTDASQSASSAGSYTTTAGTAVTISGLTKGGSSSGHVDDSRTIFSSIVCVTKDASRCVSGDTIIDANAASGVTVFLMMDLYNSVGIGDSEGALSFTGYPIASIGSVGAAIHLSYTAGSGSTKVYSEATLFLNSSGSLTWAALNTLSGDDSITGRGGFCTVAISSGPSKGANICLTSTSTTGTGTMSFPVGATCEGGTCTAGNGLLTITGWKQSVGNTASSSCSDDTNGELAGFTYAGGNCGGSRPIGSISYSIIRVVDPNNILGTCTGSYVTGQTGSCAAGGGVGTTFGIQSDGYN